ncbi:hypothetical protein CEXT_791021 [Caerostris extrusa]|uniref:Uncharacterized protein n=1 Tax=Caerostris extrusa TaxID=172846 RepID=A0AAV4V2M7_CAEEX|nr:hypothetical protein CEXT_791021 [Caerostris extrusa]
MAHPQKHSHPPWSRNWLIASSDSMDINPGMAHFLKALVDWSEFHEVSPIMARKDSMALLDVLAGILWTDVMDGILWTDVMDGILWTDVMDGIL